MIITTEQYGAAYTKLPYPIRELLASDDVNTITQGVGNQHGLHIDTIAALERETENMLLGLINPAQFVGELKSVGVPQENIGAIVEELNAKIFMPLRERMQNQPTENLEDEEELVEKTAEIVSVPTDSYVAPASVPATLTPVTAIPQAPAYVPPPAPVMQAPTVPTPAAIPTPTPAMPATPKLPTPPATDNRNALHEVLKSYGIDPYREPPE